MVGCRVGSGKGGTPFFETPAGEDGQARPRAAVPATPGELPARFPWQPPGGTSGAGGFPLFFSRGGVGAAELPSMPSCVAEEPGAAAGSGGGGSGRSGAA